MNDDEALASEAERLAETDNSVRPEDGPQPDEITEDGPDDTATAAEAGVELP